MKGLYYEQKRERRKLAHEAAPGFWDKLRIRVKRLAVAIAKGIIVMSYKLTYAISYLFFVLFGYPMQ